MKTEMTTYCGGVLPDSVCLNDAELVLLCVDSVTDTLREWAQYQYPKADVVGPVVSSSFSSCGAIESGGLVIALKFFQSHHKVFFQDGPVGLLYDAVQKRIVEDELKHVLIFGCVNKSNLEELLDILHGALPKGVSVSGGFNKGGIFVDGTVRTNGVLLIGLYGDKLEVSTGWGSGWRPFGGTKQVTGVEGNQIYELDHRPALDLYSSFLGDYKESLPDSSYLFPFGIEHGKDYLLRAAHAVDEERKSLVLGASIPRGSKLRMMTARHTDLIDAAQKAATHVHSGGLFEDSLILVCSSIARKLLMRSRADDEIQSISDIYEASRYKVFGFYSNAEACPMPGGSIALFHNQSVSITKVEELC